MNNKTPRIPTLDGWRAIAILLVLFAHFQRQLLGHFFFNQEWLDLGQHGVTIFFVLSGFLITSNLLKNESIDLRQFYIRRFFRLMPAAWTFLLVLCLLTLLTPMKSVGADLWGCLFFFRNYQVSAGSSIGITDHFWSLSVEEQFYLAWPGVLALLGRRNAAILAGVAAIAIAIFRFTHQAYYTSNYLFWLRTEVRADAIIIGCLIAFLLTRADVRAWFQRHSGVIFASCAIPLCADFYFYQSLIPLHESILVALMIAATVNNPRMIASRVLELSHIKTTGQISFSLYLWQGLFFRARWTVLGIILTPIAALLSWKLIEQPGIRAGARLSEKIERREELAAQNA